MINKSGYLGQSGKKDSIVLRQNINISRHLGGIGGMAAAATTASQTTFNNIMLRLNNIKQHSTSNIKQHHITFSNIKQH